MKRQTLDSSTSIGIVRVVKILDTENKMVVAKELGRRRNGELLFNGYRVSILQDGVSFVGGLLYNNVNILNATELYT